MSAEWTAERVLALAPDPASAKAGQGLASARKWSGLGRGEGLIWGECQGSGKDPYRTQVAPEAPAFSCSCPSRKFPCKHALGLMLVLAAGSPPIPEAEAPPWVASWKEGRDKKAEAKVEKVAREPSPADSAAKAKREAARLAKVSAGVADLDLWLADVLRQGFASLGARSGDLWEVQARRMVDAQAPGLARRLRQIDAMPLAGEGWQGALLDRLALIHLLAEGFRRRDSLPTEMAEDVAIAVGLPADLDAVRAGPGIRDRWQVLGHAMEADDRVVARRTWLLGRESGRPALVLDFTAGGKALEAGPIPGTVIDADLAFLPGSVPLRALIRDRAPEAEDFREIAGGATVAAAFAAFGSALARSPWVELIPVVLAEATVRERDGAWSAWDPAGSSVPLGKGFPAARGWHILAVSGGTPVTLTGEFDGATLHPLGFLAGDRFHPLSAAALSATAPRPVPPPPSEPTLAEATVSAVLGIDRKPPPPPADGPLADALRGLESRDPAARLLALAAAAGLSARGGRKPSATPAPPSRACPPEDRPVCPPAATLRLRGMLGGDYPEYLPESLAAMAASGSRVPHDLLAEILPRLVAYAQLPDRVAPALGVRGGWLAAENVAWKAFAPGANDDEPEPTWEVGTRSERLAVLARVRRSDPARGLALVASNFSGSPAADRIQFVHSLQIGLSMGDEPFLEAALDDRSKEVRGAAVDLLRALPGSRLCARVTGRALGQVSWDGGRLEVTLPPEWDKDAIRDGFEVETGRAPRGGPGAGRLLQLIAATPVSAFSRAFGAAPGEIIEAARGGEWERYLREGWATSVTRIPDPDWAEAVLERGADGGGSALGLLPTLPPDRRDAFVLGRLRANPGPLRPTHPTFEIVARLTDTIHGSEPVGVEVGREILARIAPILADEREGRATGTTPEGQSPSTVPRIHRLLTVIGPTLPPGLVDEAAALLGPEGEARGPFASTFATTLDRLRFRRDLHREFAP